MMVMGMHKPANSSVYRGSMELFLLTIITLDSVDL